jgi:hypothetical protein
MVQILSWDSSYKTLTLLVHYTFSQQKNEIISAMSNDTAFIEDCGTN